MDKPKRFEDIEVMVFPTGLVYHRCDDRMFAKTFTAMSGSVFTLDDAVQNEYLRQEYLKNRDIALFLTHGEWGDLTREIYNCYKEAGLCGGSDE